MAGKWEWPSFVGGSRLRLPLFAAARIVFLPLFMMCNVVLSRPRAFFPVVFRHDVFPIALTFLFGLSNGHVATIGFTQAPRRVKPEDAEVAGTLLCVSVAVGLALGAALSSLVLDIM